MRLMLCPCLGWLLLMVGPALANMRAIPPDDFHVARITCDKPVRLTHDCSIRRGANRPIELQGISMTLAADHDGDILLVSAAKPLKAFRMLALELEARGIRLRHAQAIRNGRGIAGFYLHFTGNAYNHLQRFTIVDTTH